jgi:DNA-binding transcriptional MerR regulator
MTPKEAAARIGISEATLASYRSRDLGPPFIRQPKGGVFYSDQAIRKWIAARNAGQSLEEATETCRQTRDPQLDGIEARLSDRGKLVRRVHPSLSKART